MQLSKFLSQLWLSDKECDIFTTLYKLGNQPASTVAKHVARERTGVYKILLDLTKRGLVSSTMQRGVKHFFISSPNVLLQYIHEQQHTLESLEQQYEHVTQELLQLESQRYPHLPKITLFDWVSGITTLYNDIYENVLQNKYLMIKLFASNTFESQTNVHTTLKDYAHDIFQKLKKKKVVVETYLGNGILIMEHVTKTTMIDNLHELPAWNSSINIFIVWKSLYLIIFKDIPFGIKIDSEDLSNAMHFLFEKLKIE